MAKRVGMLTELDEATMAWLEGHHIRPKDVISWDADARVGDLTTMTIRFHVSGVDEMPEPKPTITFDTFTTDDTMRKVRAGLHRAGMSAAQIQEAIAFMMIEGILFRESA